MTTTTEQTLNKLKRVIEKDLQRSSDATAKETVSVYDPSMEICGEPS
jgi:hypothetical protein